MVSTPYLHIRSGHPEFLDLPWELSVSAWDGARVVAVPLGNHRHPIRFVAYEGRLYAVKELRVHLARHEYDTLRTLESRLPNIVRAVGFAHRPWIDPAEEASGAVITERVPFGFTYRHLIRSGGFGLYREEVLNAFATLLAELHLAGCFWGDCSLSNVLYRWDAGAIDAVMLDAETSRLHPELTSGQREEDLDIMIVNVAGGMGDIAASQGMPIDDADLSLGEDIARRYRRIWADVTSDLVVARSEPERIRERTRRINALGFHVDDIEMVPEDGSDDLVRTRVAVGSRTFHATRLWDLTHIAAREGQARQILSDLDDYVAGRPDLPADLATIRWRIDVFEPLLSRIGLAVPSGADPLQLFCDFLHHRRSAGDDPSVSYGESFDRWERAGRPGYV